MYISQVLIKDGGLNRKKRNNSQREDCGGPCCFGGRAINLSAKNSVVELPAVRQNIERFSVK